MLKIFTEEDARQRNDLDAVPGEPGSGFVRYAAAMYFHRRGMIGDETLEVYRVCAKFDCEDPLQMLLKLGLADDVGVVQMKEKLS